MAAGKNRVCGVQAVCMDLKAGRLGVGWEGDRAAAARGREVLAVLSEPRIQRMCPQHYMSAKIISRKVWR